MTTSGSALAADSPRHLKIDHVHPSLSSIYQELPIEDEEEWLRQAQNASIEEQVIPSDPHERMVARLKHEVAQRQR